MNPVHDSLSTIREVLEDYLEDSTTSRFANEASANAACRARAALETLTAALQDNPPLAAHVEAFCSEVEAAKAHREAATKKGGQHIQPSLEGFSQLPSGPWGNLERYARDFRAAMERKPAPEVVTGSKQHQWDNATGRCTECAAYRHMGNPAHPWAAGQWLYSENGQEWDTAPIACSSP